MTEIFEDSRHKSKEKSESEIPKPLKKRCSSPKDMMPSSSLRGHHPLVSKKHAGAMDVDAITHSEGVCDL
jgi:hypothetical protein